MPFIRDSSTQLTQGGKRLSVRVSMTPHAPRAVRQLIIDQPIPPQSHPSIHSTARNLDKLTNERERWVITRNNYAIFGYVPFGRG